MATNCDNVFSPLHNSTLKAPTFNSSNLTLPTFTSDRKPSTGGNERCGITRGRVCGKSASANVMNDTTIRLPSSGTRVDPTSVFKDITRGTSFENDPAMRGHLDGFAKAFLSVARTEQGQEMLFSLEGIGKAIKDRNGFVDTVTMMFRLAQKVGSDPMVQFGLFLGLVGVVLALVAHFGPVGLASCGIQQVMRSLYRMLFASALGPLIKGTRSAIASFFNDNQDQGFLQELQKLR